MSDLGLTEEEQRELDTNPVSPEFVPSTPEQFALRLSIAKKLCAYALDNDPTLTADMRAIYEMYPMWGFYETAANRSDDATAAALPRRSYGVFKFADSGNGEEVAGLYMVTAHFFWVNDVVGGVPASKMVRVEQWSETSKTIIATCGAPGTFLDPLGFLIEVGRHAR